MKGLQKPYQNVHVLKGVDFAVEQGSISALLGSDGAGKTTLLKADGGQLRRCEKARRGTAVDQPDRAVRRGGRDPDWAGKSGHDCTTAAHQKTATS